MLTGMHNMYVWILSPSHPSCRNDCRDFLTTLRLIGSLISCDLFIIFRFSFQSSTHLFVRPSVIRASTAPHYILIRARKHNTHLLCNSTYQSKNIKQHMIYIIFSLHEAQKLYKYRSYSQCVTTWHTIWVHACAKQKQIIIETIKILYNKQKWL